MVELIWRILHLQSLMARNSCCSPVDLAGSIWRNCNVHSLYAYTTLTWHRFWRYGRSPIIARTAAMRTAVTNLVKLYSRSVQQMGPFRSIKDLAAVVNLSHLYQETTFSYLSRSGVSDKFISELLSAGSTVNYAQSSYTLHALEGLVSIAAEVSTILKITASLITGM